MSLDARVDVRRRSSHVYDLDVGSISLARFATAHRSARAGSRPSQGLDLLPQVAVHEIVHGATGSYEIAAALRYYRTSRIDTGQVLCLCRRGRPAPAA
jgi:hypothetical protein